MCGAAAAIGVYIGEVPTPVPALACVAAAYAVANPLVVQQSVEQITTALPLETKKFITINGGAPNLYPCDSSSKNIFFVKSAS